MRKFVLIAASSTVLLMPSNVFAQSSSQASVSTGNGLWDHCQAPNLSWREGFCDGYVVGVSDLAQIARGVCPPYGVTNQQILDIVKAGLRDHPEERQRLSASLVMKYLSTTFPCPAK